MLVVGADGEGWLLGMYLTSKDHDRDEEQERSRWRALAVVMAAGAMTLLDVSIVNVALPTLRAGLGADDSDVQWIVAGYALAFGVALVPMGRLGDARSRDMIGDCWMRIFMPLRSASFSTGFLVV